MDMNIENVFIGIVIVGIVVFIIIKGRALIARRKYRDSLPERTHGGGEVNPRRDRDQDTSQ